MKPEASRPPPSLGLFATAMLVMGGIVGSGIFINPHVVAKAAPSSVAVLLAWALGGAVALAGGFIWAELAARRPGVGGQYAYLRDGVHPAAGFVYGWSNLVVTQTGGMAAVAVTFARYAHVLAPPPWSEAWTAVAALAVLTAINLFGVKEGSAVQSALMVLKIGAIGAVIAFGLFVAPKAISVQAGTAAPVGGGEFLVAMIAVLFAYGGWATATFVSGEIKDQARTLPRALILGSLGVVVLYLGINAAFLAALGPDGLATIDTPASEVMRRAMGSPGATAIAAAIAVSTFGFLAQGMLVCPRVYYAMAQDGVFFKSVGRLHPRTQVPHVAIVLQGIFAIATTLSGSYEEILSWVVTVDFAFLALTAATLFVFRRRDRADAAVRAPLHPWSTVFFIAVSLLVVGATFVEHPYRSLLGWTLVAAGWPVYSIWKRRTA